MFHIYSVGEARIPHPMNREILDMAVVTMLHASLPHPVTACICLDGHSVTPIVAFTPRHDIFKILKNLELMDKVLDGMAAMREIEKGLD